MGKNRKMIQTTYSKRGVGVMLEWIVAVLGILVIVGLGVGMALWGILKLIKINRKK